MTKSTIPRKQLIKKAQEQIEFCRHTKITGEGRAHVNQCAALFEIALAAMDSEPVAIIDQANLDYLRSGADADVWPPEREEMGDVLLYRHPQPAPVVPELRVDWQENEFSAGWNACRAAMLAAAPQSPGSEPATVPGKWIPVSEQKPDCWCRTCRPVTLNDMRFVVCPDCGNKRCPRANDHRNACTRSNEPGQEGSAYPVAPQEVRGE
ncbi:TPA: hypothetical protein ACM62B_001396 [Klebsiella pneumoniae]